MNKIFLKFFLILLILLFVFQQKFIILALKCRMEDEPSDDELRKIIHTCVKKIIGNNESTENFYNNAYEYNNNGTNRSNNNGNGNNNNPSWMSSNKNNNNDGFDGNEDYDRIRNREHLQMRPFKNFDNKKLIRIKLNILNRKHFANNYDLNNNNNQNRQQQQLQQHQLQLYNNYNNNNNDNNYQRYNNMDMDYGGNIGGNPSMQQYDMNMSNGRDNNNNHNNNNNMHHDFNNNNSNDYDNNGQNEQNNHNNNNNNNKNGNWNYYQNKTNKFNTKQQDKQKQHDGACIVHCFFGELKMLNNDDYPDKRKVIQILTKDIKNNDLREFYTESVKECFHLIEVESKHRDKCEFAKTLINCMTDYAKINCEDWDDKTIIF